MHTKPAFVVAISRQIGAGGAYVGQGLARRLHFRYVDREILQQAAILLGREEGDLEALEERAASMWDRMASILSIGAPEAPFVPPPLPTLGEDELFEVESQVMREIAAREDAVFVGRAASWVLRDHPSIIRVFLHAPEEWRVDRILESYTLPDRAAAVQLIRRSDQKRSRFLQSVVHLMWTDPRTYDLCIDTSRLGFDAVIELLTAVAAFKKKVALGPRP
jgi:cytidylate kinase